MTAYRRKATIKAWQNLPTADVPRWVLAQRSIGLTIKGGLKITDSHHNPASGYCAAREIPDGAWIVMEGETLSILSPAEFSDQFEPHLPPVTVRDTFGQPPFPPRRYGLSGTGPLGDPTDTAMMGEVSAPPYTGQPLF